MLLRRLFALGFLASSLSAAEGAMVRREMEASVDLFAIGFRVGTIF